LKSLGGAGHVETPGAAGGFVRGLAGLFMARFQSLDPEKWWPVWRIHSELACRGRRLLRARLSGSLLSGNNDAHVSFVFALGMSSKANADIGASRVEFRDAKQLLAMQRSRQIFIKD